MGWEKVVKELCDLLINLPNDRFWVLAGLTALLIVAWAMKGS